MMLGYPAHRHQRGGLPTAVAHGPSARVDSAQPGSDARTAGRSLRIWLGAGFQAGVGSVE